MRTTESLSVFPRSAGPITKGMLWMEFLALYGVLPALVAGFVRPERAQRLLGKVGIDWLSFDTGLPRGTFVFPVLLITFLVMFLWLRLDKRFDNQRLWNWGAFKDAFRRIVIRFAIAGPFLAGAAWWLAYKTPLLAEQGFFYLPRERLGLMLAIACLYPWVSAYPQEVTHRAFFFHRYAPIMGIGRMAFFMNVIAFVWLHAPMWNVIALLMTLPAGVLFAWTYRRTGSTLAAGFEHAIYGVWVFTTGLGYFVFAGN